MVHWVSLPLIRLPLNNFLRGVSFNTSTCHRARARGVVYARCDERLRGERGRRGKGARVCLLARGGERACLTRERAQVWLRLWYHDERGRRRAGWAGACGGW